jgi:hypothetical protein
MDLQLLIPLLALGIAGYSAYLQHQQVKLMTAGQESLPGIPVPAPWWKAPAVVATFLLALLAWVPWVWSTWLIAKNQPTVALAAWGLRDITDWQLQITIISAREADPSRQRPLLG